MSTKTSIKRIALVAVSALGFGLLSVVPANAALGGGDTTVTAGTSTAATSYQTIAVGATLSVPIFLAFNAQLDEDDTITVTPSLTAANDAPAGSAIAVGASAFGKIGMTTTGAADPFVTTAAATKATVSVSAGVLTVTGGADNVAASTAKRVGTLEVTPDKAGVYKIAVTPDGTAGETHTAATIWVYATAAAVSPTGTATLAASWGQPTYRILVGGGPNGTLVDPVLTISAAAGQAATVDEVPVRAMVTQSPDAQLPIGAILGSSDDSTAKTNAISNIFVFNNSADGSTTLTLNTKAGSGTDLIDTSGTYGFLVFEDANSDGRYTSGERFVTTSVVLAGAPTAYSFSANPSGIAQPGQVISMTMTLTDSLGRRTILAGSEQIDLTEPTSGHLDVAAAAEALTKADEQTTGGLYFGDYRFATTVSASATSGTKTVTALGSAGSTLVGVTGSFSIVVGASEVGTSLAYTSETTIAAAAATDVELTVAGDPTGALTVDVADTSVNFTAKSTTASEYIKVTITPTGTSLSSTRMSVSGTQLYRALADKTAAFGVTITSPVAGDSYTVTLEAGTTDLVYTVTYAAVTPSWTILPGASLAQKNGSTSTFVAILKDQFDRAQTSKAVTLTVTGRNPSTAALTTDAAGRVSFEVKDTYAGTDLTSDSITLSYTYLNAAGTATIAGGNTASIAYTATGVVVGSVVVTASETTARTIDQVERVAGSPASTAIVTYTAVVKLASGASAGAGVVVTFSGGADDKFVNGLNQGVTGSTGVATASVYRQKTGFAAISAVANGVTGVAAPLQWTNAAGDARTVSVSVDPSSIVSEATATVKATVTDRWGNPVSGVAVTFTEVGAGRLSTSAAVNTNSAGIAQVDFTSAKNETGSNTITASISGGQSGDLAGFVGTTAVAGVAAGIDEASTSVTVTKDTSVSTADALLALAKAIGTGNEANAAADAALEAIDAANAATDAANLAAEAADAATVAAEEARDAADAATAAVEALASEVATLTAALKAQITALANTVAKIAKKVKA